MLVTPIDPVRHPQVLFERPKEEITKAEPNLLQFRHGLDFDKHFDPLENGGVGVEVKTDMKGLEKQSPNKENKLAPPTNLDFGSPLMKI